MLDSQQLADFFVNFDLDVDAELSARTFRRIAELTCALATEAVGDDGADDDESGASFGSVQLRALQLNSQLMRSLLEMSGHARSSLASSLSLDETSAALRTNALLRDSLARRSAFDACLASARDLSASKGVAKALEALEGQGVRGATSPGIPAFLRVHHEVFRPEDVGDFLGSGDGAAADQLRLSFFSLVDFRGMSIIQGLRHFLTKAHFRLPGEARISHVLRIESASFILFTNLCIL